MDCKRNFKAWIVGVFCVACLALVTTQSFGVVTNGFFDSSLSGWSYNDAGGVVWSSTGFYDEPDNGAALLQQSLDGTLASSGLWQTFYVDPGSSSLSFQVRTPVPLFDETDHLYIQLLDSTNNPLLGNPGNDYFFHWKSGKEFDADPDKGWIQSETPAGISVTEDPFIIANSYLYSFDIPVASGWINNDITLRFKLNNDYNDSSETVILVDNVVLNNGTPPLVVPVPGAMGLVLAGLAALGVFRKKLA
jgi:hypothetical protein